MPDQRGAATVYKCTTVDAAILLFGSETGRQAALAAAGIGRDDFSAYPVGREDVVGDPGTQMDTTAHGTAVTGLLMALSREWSAMAASGVLVHEPSRTEPEVTSATPLRAYRLREVHWRGRRLALRYEIECAVTRDEGLYVIEHKPLGIRAYAEELAAAKRDFAEEFFVLWEDFGLAPDEELAPEGIKLKQRLRALVERGTAADEA